MNTYMYMFICHIHEYMSVDIHEYEYMQLSDFSPVL